MHVPVEEWSRGKRVEDRRPELHAGRGGELRAARYFGRPRECDRFRASGETGDLLQAGQVAVILSLETCELGIEIARLHCFKLGARFYSSAHEMIEMESIYI